MIQPAAPTIAESSLEIGGLTSQSFFSFRFDVSTQSRTYHLAADTKEAHDKWVTSLTKFSMASRIDVGCFLPDLTLQHLEMVDNVFSQDVVAVSASEEAPEGIVALTFTSISDSYKLWELYPDAMTKAIEIHDSILRRLIKLFRGYEVKTEKDAFMIAFFNCLDAILFSLSAQKELLSAEWPTELFSHSAASRELDSHGKMVWSGLRVAMGIEYGDTSCKRNPVTKRMDYFGPTVNRAARIAHVAHGGQILISETAFGLVGSNPETASKICSKTLGAYCFKGIKVPVSVVEVTCRELESRSFPEIRATRCPASSSADSSSPPDLSDSNDHIFPLSSSAIPSLDEIEVDSVFAEEEEVVSNSD